MLCEIEESINNISLAYVSNDDLDDALTPYHLIHGRNISKPSKAIDFIPATDVENCKRRLHHVRKVLRDCWTRFHSTYLNELRQINLYRKCRSNDSRHASVGDVVLIKEDEPSVRTEWRMGKVIELVKGRDDQVRGAKLKFLSKTGKQKVLFRPLQKLIPFEISENRESEDQGESEEFEDNKAEDENQKQQVEVTNDENNQNRTRLLWYSFLLRGVCGEYLITFLLCYIEVSLTERMTESRDFWTVAGSVCCAIRIWKR